MLFAGVSRGLRRSRLHIARAARPQHRERRGDRVQRRRHPLSRGIAASRAIQPLRGRDKRRIRAHEPCSAKARRARQTQVWLTTGYAATNSQHWSLTPNRITKET